MIVIADVAHPATIQDLGRPGYGHLGVPRAGAADPSALRLGNRLVGNHPEAAGLEFVLGEFAVAFESSVWFALCGAPTDARLNDRPISHHTAVLARPGDVVRGRRPPLGIYTYLTVSGGVDVLPVLGSRSTDTLSGIGPATLRTGDQLELGPWPGSPPAAGDCVPETVDACNDLTVSFRWGPRADWFSAGTRALLVSAAWQVSSLTNRIAARLDGPMLPYACDRQLPSEGMHGGSIQVSPSGQAIVHLANHPPTGGYPVIGVVRPHDTARIAQSSPGTTIRFEHDHHNQRSRSSSPDRTGTTS